mgnify:CR=1|jgi:hypothetical protein
MSGTKACDRYVPTPEEILEGCRKIREGWPPERERAQAGIVKWDVPRMINPNFKPTGSD